VEEPNGTGLSFVLGAACGIALIWTVLIRPRATAYAQMLVLHNPVTDLHIPLAGIDAVIVRHALLVWVGERRYTCPGIGRSSRSLARRRSRGPLAILGLEQTDDRLGAGQLADIDPTADYASFVEQRIAELGRAARRDAPLAGPAVVRRTWAWRELAVLGGLAAAFLLSLLL
jgi:hypothetical protein